MPKSKLLLGFLYKNFEMIFPKKVSFPVANTTATPKPEATFVPEKQIFSK
jgi:hypothetical protein